MKMKLFFAILSKNKLDILYIGQIKIYTGVSIEKVSSKRGVSE